MEYLFPITSHLTSANNLIIFRDSRSVVVYLISTSFNLNNRNMIILISDLYLLTASVPAGISLNWKSISSKTLKLASVAR